MRGHFFVIMGYVLMVLIGFILIGSLFFHIPVIAHFKEINILLKIVSALIFCLSLVYLILYLFYFTHPHYDIFLLGVLGIIIGISGFNQHVILLNTVLCGLCILGIGVLLITLLPRLNIKISETRHFGFRKIMNVIWIISYGLVGIGLLAGAGYTGFYLYLMIGSGDFLSIFFPALFFLFLLAAGYVLVRASIGNLKKFFSVWPGSSTR